MRRLAAIFSGFGGGVSTLAFFLPWVSFNCAGENRTVSGLEMAQESDPATWAVLVCAVALLMLGPLLGEHALGFLLRLALALTGTALLVYQYLHQVHDAELELKVWGHTLEAISVRLEPGGYGAIGGFLLAILASAIGLKAQEPDQSS
jgi:flagellar biosynthesis protein FliR